MAEGWANFRNETEFDTDKVTTGEKGKIWRAI
jgi:hypothetical protein